MFVLKYEAQFMFLCVGATQAEGCRCTAVKHSKMSTVCMEEGGTTSIERAVGFTILQAAQNNCIVFLLKTTRLPVVNTLRMQHDKASWAEKTPMRWSGS